MSSVRTSPLRIATSARLFAVFAALLAGAFALTGAVVYFATGRTADHEIRERILLEMRAMEVERDREGFELMVAAIRARADHPGALAYRLESAGGSLLIDDLRMPAVQTGWMRGRSAKDLSAVSATRTSEPLIVLSKRLQDGSLLSVGDDLGQAEAVRGAVLSALGWSGAGALSLGLVAAAFATRRSLSRMNRVADAVARFTAGDHTVRAPVSARRIRDDVDTIAAGVNDMLERIATLIASIRRVSTAVAHDLRTPLAHVRQRLETVRDARVSPGERTRAAHAAQVEIDDVLRTFEAILSLAEIEAAAGAQPFETLDLALLADAVADAYCADIEASGRAIEVCRAGPVEIRGDRYLLTRAIANLLENAMRHTATGTRIAIEAVRCRDIARLAITDNGSGLAPRERERVVEPFYRVDRSRSTRGSGLGLAMVAAIAKRHHATLRLEEARPGLRVVLEFDLAPVVAMCRAAAAD